MIKAVGPKISFPISPAIVAGNLFFATNVPSICKPDISSAGRSKRRPGKFSQSRELC